MKYDQIFLQIRFIFNFNADVRMFIFNCIERKCFNDEIKNVVVIELCDFNSTNSVSLKLIISFMKIDFESLIYAFNLTVCLRIMNDEEFYFNAEAVIYLILKVIDKL